MNNTILVDAYFNNNFGDDLFLKILTEKFSDYKFDFLVRDKCQVKAFEGQDQINFIGRRNAFFKVKKYSAFVYIGGSLFQEHSNWKKQYKILNATISWCKLNSIPTFIIGFNFGPYKSEEFSKKYSSLFKKVSAITVRDNESFEKFSQQDINISIFPDIVQSMKVLEYSKEKKNILGISIIDSPQMNVEQKQLYTETIVNFIKKFGKSYSQIKLFSFQDTETISDLKMINSNILEFLDTEKNSIRIINYDGDMEQFIKEYSECDSCITGRFHSLVLSILLGQKFFPFIYDEKIKNYLNSLSIDYYSNFTKNHPNINLKDFENNFFVACEELRNELQKKSSGHFEELINYLK
ncbi:polysaccharide pyruvyl transferase family protein [Enterococcus gilvus]|uniref:polysaccharide pyruvyl transferase family protein n=1 Tax=Enterococcus gilvus TaxID=160453 RepID=UPI00290C7AAB|nr:polysaccharide pyruvyl transferase family protein [Enterococcus gilvus]MDU5509055.1 polysaccharide pyruvyl transferase family protein [Enterococcus gilvus]